MPVAGEWVWMRHPTGHVWHLAQWLGGTRGVEQPPCGLRAPAWIRWMRGGQPVGERDELCRPCLQRAQLAERREGRVLV